jgi:hypothetical protein
LIGFTAKDKQVNIAQEMREIFMCFFIGNYFGVVAAAIYRNVDCEDYISHVPTPHSDTLAALQLFNYRSTPEKSHNR